ncbi:AraC family transcriptional regulator [Paenibacillus sp. P96]|uniref:AraC family transcriptional regulator n=1 Tax=Paenibacillus zeirhizosphaerae TaxID=2987519 RepID=A0ABT9FT21_9BACL|nr:AraC family transcriptional regulator [Paenibacillus sp. P96]MDP4097824.1 AraC family transcriptional regulator [Paenibacillus sp. P96]
MDASNPFYFGLLDGLTVSVSHAQQRSTYAGWNRSEEQPSFNRLYFIAGGEGKVVINDVPYYPRANQVMLMPAFTRQITETSVHNPYDRYFIHFDARIGEWPLFHAASRLFITDVSEPAAVRSLFADTITQFNRPSVYSVLRMKASVLSILACCFEEEGHTDFIHEFVLPAEHGNLANVLQYINSHLHEQLQVEQLAEIMHLHPNYFISYFKKYMGVTPMRYVLEKRMEEARHLLSFSDWGITDIAEHMGIELAYFSRKFKQLHGVSPKAYRAATNDSVHS